MATQYEEEILEPELKPEYVEHARKIMRHKPVDLGSVEHLRTRLDI